MATPRETLRKHVSGKIAANERTLGVPERHQLKIARATMRMHCVGARIMGGPNHHESVRIIADLTGAIIGIDADCTCTN